MSRLTLLTLAILALIGIGSAALTLQAQGQKDVVQPEGLSGKAVLVMSKDGKPVATLEQPRLRSIGGRQFVVGKETGSKFSRDTFGGATLWISLDDVTQLVELPSEKDTPK